MIKSRIIFWMTDNYQSKLKKKNNGMGLDDNCINF